MSLRLTDGQLRQIRELQRLLVAPLRFPDTDSWTAAIHEAATDLFGVDRSLLVFPDASGGVLSDSPNLGEPAFRKLRETLTGTRTSANQYDDPLLDRQMKRLATSGVEVWNREIAERVSRISVEEMPRFYPEVLRPYELEGFLLMAHSLPEGRAHLHVLPGRGETTIFGDDALDVFRLLLPAFKAGSRTYALASRRRGRLRASLDLLQDGVAVFRDGRESYRNHALRKLLSVEEREEDLTEAIAACAGRLRRALGERTVPGRDLNSSIKVTTSTSRYGLAASHLEDGYGEAPVTVLVVVRPVTPPLPDELELRERYGLTPRQAEVALLLARGHSNREIADRLTISPHTARHHAQRVLEKTGTSNRKALALHLLADGR